MGATIEKLLHFHLYHIGTLYSPTDGTIDPNGICTATTRSAKKAGAKVSHYFGEHVQKTCNRYRNSFIKSNLPQTQGLWMLLYFR